MRTWHKVLPMKYAHENWGIYNGIWSSQMDRYWESSDGYHVSSRQIRTPWGVVEHAVIGRMSMRGGDIPWAVKRQIKEELFGIRANAIEIFPDRKRLVDVMDEYHLWILPKDFKIPFGIHPTKDPQYPAIERGYDFTPEESQAWIDSEERKTIHDKGIALWDLVENANA